MKEKVFNCFLLFFQEDRLEPPFLQARPLLSCETYQCFQVAMLSYVASLSFLFWRCLKGMVRIKKKQLVGRLPTFLYSNNNIYMQKLNTACRRTMSVFLPVFLFIYFSIQKSVHDFLSTSFGTVIAESQQIPECMCYFFL